MVLCQLPMSVPAVERAGRTATVKCHETDTTLDQPATEKTHATEFCLAFVRAVEAVETVCGFAFARKVGDFRGGCLLSGSQLVGGNSGSEFAVLRVMPQVL